MSDYVPPSEYPQLTSTTTTSAVAVAARATTATTPSSENNVLRKRKRNNSETAQEEENNDDDGRVITAVEYSQWMSKIEEARRNRFDVEFILKDAPYRIKNNKKIVIAAVQKDGSALYYASPSLQNDKEVVMAAVQKYGYALVFASPSLQNDKKVVLAAVKEDSHALQYASPSLQNDKEVVMAAVKEYGDALQYATPSLRNDKEVVMTAVKQDGDAFKFASPSLQNDKDVVLLYLKHKPDYIKYLNDDFKKDKDILIAAKQYNEDHTKGGAEARKQLGIKKVVLSTKFALNPTSESEATNFTALFKESEYVQTRGKFEVYAPNANNKKCCDPTFTAFDHPCRGGDTCKYNNILTDDGRPTDDCCWKYSYRSQLEEAKDTGGFMLQLVETGKLVRYTNDATLGMGQTIELDMANKMGIKVFQIYRPVAKVGSVDEHEAFFHGGSDIVAVTDKISEWYDNQCEDMSVTIIRPLSRYE